MFPRLREGPKRQIRRDDYDELGARRVWFRSGPDVSGQTVGSHRERAGPAGHDTPRWEE